MYGWSEQLLSALVYLHDHGVVHSNICCDTIVLTDDLRTLKVTCFERAVVEQAIQSPPTSITHSNNSSRRSSLENTRSEHVSEPRDAHTFHLEGKNSHSAQSTDSSLNKVGDSPPERPPVGQDSLQGVKKDNRKNVKLSSQIATPGQETEGGDSNGAPIVAPGSSLAAGEEEASGLNKNVDLDKVSIKLQGIHTLSDYLGTGSKEKYHRHEAHRHVHYDAQFLAYTRDHFARRSIEEKEHQVMRSHGDPKTDVFQGAMIMWEIASGKSPQHPSAQMHIPEYAKIQVPPLQMRATGFATYVNFTIDSKYRPDPRAIAWKQFRELIEDVFEADTRNLHAVTSADLLERLKGLRGRPAPDCDPSPSVRDLEVFGGKCACACVVQ